MFIINTDKDKQRAIDFIKAMPLSPVQYVDIDDYKRNRTNSQNRYFHKAVKIIADESGYTPKEVKDKLVLSIWPPIIRQVTVHKDGKKEVYSLAERRSTATLDTKEFSMLLDAIMIVAHQLKITLPIPDDFKEMMREI